jgi:alanine-glyoxylate transaminase/serine-glyoxylate transaminase/serine-pyruvate transaminase
MSLANGREFLAIPGPSVIPDAVLQAMHRPAVNIYEGELEAITNGLLADLPALARTAGRAFIYIANGHGAWEAALANTLSRGDRALALDSGRFGLGWAEMARQMGVDCAVLTAEPRRAIDPDRLEDALRADVDRKIKAVMAVQIDTASGVINDIPAIRAAMDAAGHPALLMVDVIASQGCVPYEMDAWRVDVTVGGAQKGLMTPPGLAFTWANERAFAASATADLRTQYWDWRLRTEAPHYRKYCGTPPVHLLFALRKAVDMLTEEGLEAVWARHATMATATRAAVAAWAADGPLEFHVLEPAERSDSVTTIHAPGVDVARFRAFCQSELGLVLGLGLGEFGANAFRIGHMGWLNAPMLMGALGAAQAGMVACGIAHGKGALDAAADVIAARAR